uniref:Uncharacterized protein n=1 Tax=Oryza brachyantha TaxID=4533 RepID=J3NDS3_ORYBR
MSVNLAFFSSEKNVLVWLAVPTSAAASAASPHTTHRSATSATFTLLSNPIHQRSNVDVGARDRWMDGWSWAMAPSMAIL